jgi:hypothetical protein
MKKLKLLHISMDVFGSIIVLGFLLFGSLARAGHVYINATQVAFQIGSTNVLTMTLPPGIVAASGIPANATRLYFQALVRNPTNANGTCDAYVGLSSPSGAWGGEALGVSGGFGMANYFVEHQFSFDVPNESGAPFSFNWTMGGTILSNPTYGMNWTVNFIGWDQP